MTATDVLMEGRSARWLERWDQMNPPDVRPFKELACAVIFDAAKEYKGRRDQVPSLHYFLTPDYRFWARMAGLEVGGESIINALVANGGISKEARVHFSNAIGGE